MTPKEKILKAVNELSDDASFKDAIEKLLVLANIERGLMLADQGEMLSHQTVK